MARSCDLFRDQSKAPTVTVTFRRSVIGLVRSTVFSTVVWMSSASAETAPRPTLIILPGTGIALSGPRGGPFVPLSFQYRVSTSTGVARFSITTPSWLLASPRFGTTDTSGVPVAFHVSAEALRLPPGTYGPSIGFTNLTNGRGSTTRTASLTIQVPQPDPGLTTGDGRLLDDHGGRLLGDQGEHLLAK